MNPSKNTNPQHDLAASILDQARQDLRRFHGATRPTKRELYLDAYEWVLSDSCRWPFSFRNVCEILNLSPEFVRHEVLSDVSAGTVNYWSRRFGTALRQFHISLREVLIRERNRAAAPTALVGHGLY